VANPQWQEADTSKPGTIVMVRGQVGEGDFVPVVTNAVISRLGYWNLAEAPRVTLEEALTGVHDGRWVEMRGFVRQFKVLDGLVRFNLTTSSGEFEAWTPASQSFEAWRGSIIRVHGVCAAICNARRQLTGIRVWAPEVKYLRIEEAAPDDLFALPLRPLDSLRRFNSQNTLDQRVRTLGTVVLHEPGSYLYVQDGIDSVHASVNSRTRCGRATASRWWIPGQRRQAVCPARGGLSAPVERPGTRSRGIVRGALGKPGPGRAAGQRRRCPPQQSQQGRRSAAPVQTSDSIFEAGLALTSTDLARNVEACKSTVAWL